MELLEAAGSAKPAGTATADSAKALIWLSQAAFSAHRDL